MKHLFSKKEVKNRKDVMGYRSCTSGCYGSCISTCFGCTGGCRAICTGLFFTS